MIKRNNYSDYCSPGTDIQTRYIGVSNKIQLFEIHFTPKKLTKYPPVIFIPGWGSFIHGWKIVLKEMSRHFEIYYIETREKSSAKHVKEQKKHQKLDQTVNQASKSVTMVWDQNC